MGHSQASKQQTHERIVEIAAKKFCEMGVDGLSIADLMKEAGLTHGGFYKHFSSRDELVAEALAVALERSRKTEKGNFETLVSGYLNEQHRDAVGDGCAVGALINDMGRAEGDARLQYSAQLKHNLHHMMGLLASADGDGDGDGDGDAKAKAMVAYSAMIGALGLSRAVDDPELSEAILANVRDHLLTAFLPQQDD